MQLVFTPSDRSPGESAGLGRSELGRRRGAGRFGWPAGRPALCARPSARREQARPKPLPQCAGGQTTSKRLLPEIRNGSGGAQRTSWSGARLAVRASGATSGDKSGLEKRETNMKRTAFVLAVGIAIGAAAVGAAAYLGHHGKSVKGLTAPGTVLVATRLIPKAPPGPRSPSRTSSGLPRSRRNRWRPQRSAIRGCCWDGSQQRTSFRANSWRRAISRRRIRTPRVRHARLALRRRCRFARWRVQPISGSTEG
jgi:hypothetical protein